MRFVTSLLTTTSMVKDNERPISYLNKGQTYGISVRDTTPAMHRSGLTTYRTSFRIDFHGDEQRQDAQRLWQQWKDERVQQPGGIAPALEHITEARLPAQVLKLSLEEQSFDGFSRIWTARNSAVPEFSFRFRCNFLSTDFSTLKGVKGVPLRLYATTEVIDHFGTNAAHHSSETSYCKIKLFRPHGAERKMTNDKATLDRLISKLHEQVGKEDLKSEAVEEAVMEEDGNEENEDEENGAFLEFVPSSEIESSYSPQDRPTKIRKLERTSDTTAKGSAPSPSAAKAGLLSQIQVHRRLKRSKQDTTPFFICGQDEDG